LALEESQLREEDEAKRKASGVEEEDTDGQESGIGAISFVSCATGNQRTDDDQGKQVCSL
jgi:hypothetical protein